MRVTATVRQMETTEHLWRRVFSTNDFAIEVAGSLGLWRPPGLLPPDVWVANLRAMN